MKPLVLRKQFNSVKPKIKLKMILMEDFKKNCTHALVIGHFSVRPPYPMDIVIKKLVTKSSEG